MGHFIIIIIITAIPVVICTIYSKRNLSLDKFQLTRAHNNSIIIAINH